ncbi:MAG: hypothetical protein ACK546_01085 [bacterium]|jgi:hypothetical protein
MTLLDLQSRNSAEGRTEELSLAQLEDVRGGFIWILARFYMQQVYIRSKKDKEEQDEEEFFRRVILD